MAMADDDRETDRALVHSFLRDRRETSFRLLYRRHTPAMIRFAGRLAANSEVSAEDAVQEAWVRAVRLLPRFAWRSSLRSWLAGILVNVVRELRRKTSIRAADADGGAGVDVVEPWADPACAIGLSEAMRGLPEGYRAILTLHDVAGFTHAEIAEIMGIEVGTSKSQLARARHRLRRQLGDNNEGDIE